jgi:ferritin-like protein
MVPFDEDYIYVTELKEGMDFDTTEVKTFPTQEEAEHAADFWRLPGKESLVKVVEYDSNS